MFSKLRALPLDIRRQYVPQGREPLGLRCGHVTLKSMDLEVQALHGRGLLLLEALRLMESYK